MNAIEIITEIPNSHVALVAQPSTKNEYAVVAVLVIEPEWLSLRRFTAAVTHLWLRSYDFLIALVGHLHAEKGRTTFAFTDTPTLIV